MLSILHFGTFWHDSPSNHCLSPRAAVGFTILLVMSFGQVGQMVNIKNFQGMALDRFLQQSGLSAMLDRSGSSGNGLWRNGLLEIAPAGVPTRLSASTQVSIRY
jgi:hypothetical protein